MGIHEQSFSHAVSEVYGIKPLTILDDGKLHRFSPNPDKPESKSGWYIYHHNHDFDVAVFGDWRSGEKLKWASRKLNQEEKILASKNMMEKQIQLKEDIDSRKQETKMWLSKHWPISKCAQANHDYLIRKQIKAHGIKQYKDTLQIPMFNKDQELVGMQLINPDGSKFFKVGSEVKGSFFDIGAPDQNDQKHIFIAEGYATAASLYEHGGMHVRIAFSASNLQRVSEITRAQNPNAHIVIASDNDVFNDQNTGLHFAKKAAESVNGQVIVPNFKCMSTQEIYDLKCTDFNDVLVHLGALALRKQVATALLVPTVER